MKVNLNKDNQLRQLKRKLKIKQLKWFQKAKPKIKKRVSKYYEKLFIDKMLNNNMLDDEALTFMDLEAKKLKGKEIAYRRKAMGTYNIYKTDALRLARKMVKTRVRLTSYLTACDKLQRILDNMEVKEDDNK